MSRPFTVPADGPDLYQCFVIPLPPAPQRYVRAIDIRPGNTRVVHHALLFQDVTGEAKRRDTGGGYSCFGTPGFLPARGLGGWTPGKQPVPEPAGMAEPLYPRSDLVLQVHYHATGKRETDRTRVALYFTAQPPRLHLTDGALGSSRIDIPAGARDFVVRDRFTLPVDVDLFGIIPHAHYVCKDMRVYAILPNGGLESENFLVLRELLLKRGKNGGTLVETPSHKEMAGFLQARRALPTCSPSTLKKRCGGRISTTLCR